MTAVTAQQDSAFATVNGCDNADIHMKLDLADEPGVSTLTLRVATWDERNAGETPTDIYDREDWVNLDLDDMRALRAALDQQIARVEAHDAAFDADDDEAAAVVNDARPTFTPSTQDADDTTDGM